MELEYTWSALGTATGCTAAVVLITQYVKDYLPKWLPTRVFVLVLTFAILMGVWWFGMDVHDLTQIPLIMLNSFTIALAAMGAYSTAISKAKTTTDPTTTDTTA